VQAKIVVEASNIPAKPEIEETLHKKGVLVIPDFVANAGGVISSYAEYKGYDERKAFELIKKKIVKNTKLVIKEANKLNVKPRDAALKIAKERIK
jgi:glutamate dehydrogenase/leucine dehydrogenase